MLGLFKEEGPKIYGEEAKMVARSLLISSLNKGRIPSWEEFLRELPEITVPEDLEMIQEHFLELTQWSFLQEILAFPANEYFFHSTTHSQKLLSDNSKVHLAIPLKQEDWQIWLEILSIRFHQNWNVQNPFVSFFAELFGKTYRLSLIHGSTSPQGQSKLMLRSLSATPYSLESFGEKTFLEKLIQEKRNFLVSGSTGSGKTSLLSSLIELSDSNEHLVILEDTFEIMSSHPHQTRFLSGESQETSLRSYLAYSLRLSPDRIVLGEMRSHEVVPFLMAMNTGHKGLIGTIHASSGVDTLNRVALLFSIYGGETSLHFERVMELLCRNLEYVVFMENKKVKEIIKVLGADKGVPFFEKIFPREDIAY